MGGGVYPVAGVDVGTWLSSRPASMPMTMPMPPSNNAPTTPMTVGTIQRPRGGPYCGPTISVGPVIYAGCGPLRGAKLVGAALAAMGPAIVAKLDDDEPMAVNARAAARLKAPADPYRSSGCLAIPRATTSSRAAGTRGLMALVRGG